MIAREDLIQPEQATEEEAIRQVMGVEPVGWIVGVLLTAKGMVETTYPVEVHNLHDPNIHLKFALLSASLPPALPQLNFDI